MISITKAQLRERIQNAPARAKRAYSRRRPGQPIAYHKACPRCTTGIVRVDAPCCFRCAGLSPVMQELEAAIASGRTQPRLTMAQILHPASGRV